ncbi:hypothetical protein ABE545_09485 [Sphingobacterium faecium]|uniref:hypothetical protein n=1 Tax=Sphingobacterium faecium TaxID=34087 RepID=UPI00320A2C4F
MIKTIIPTYIINLEKRKDRRLYIEQEFANRVEFNLTIVKAIEDKVPAIGLYKTVKNILIQAKGLLLPYVLICEDDHQFTKNYNAIDFVKAINYLNKEDVDIYLGGISWFDYAIEKKGEFYWVNSFNGTQFMIIYSRSYDRLLNADFQEDMTIDIWISQLSKKVYVSVPMLSIQKDFGYSDVTEKNNVSGKVEKYFRDTINRFEALGHIYDYLYNRPLPLVIPDFRDMQLPTYIIGFKFHKNNLSHVMSQFKFRNEFKLTRIEAFCEKKGTLSLWKSIRQTIKLAKKRKDDVILICEDDHVFCEYYDKKILFSSIYQGSYLGADIILGGISHIGQAIPISEYLCWIDKFQSKQFIVIFNHFFDSILEEEFNDYDAIDLKFSEMTPNKYVIHPFISLQNNFDISLKGLNTQKQLNVFQKCHLQLDNIRLKKSLS